MTDARTKVLSLLLTLLVVVGTIPAMSVGPVAASTGNTAGNATTFHVEQGDQCYEVEALGDGTQSVEEFYDYRKPTNDDSKHNYSYSSLGTTDLQGNQESKLFIYNGSNGTSLVFLHDKYAVDGTDGSNASTITFNLSGMPSDGEWVVQDDNYNIDGDTNDDNWNVSGTHHQIDWMWASNRTDGGAFRGIEGANITIEPGFNESASEWGSWSYSGDPDNRTESWDLIYANETEESLDMGQNVTVSTGSCPDETDPNAALTASPNPAGNNEEVTLDASNSTDDESGIAEYRWDVNGDGETDKVTDTATVKHTYTSTGEYDASVTVVDENDNNDTASVTVTVEEQTSDSPPSASLSVSPEVAGNDEEVTFDASNSTDDGSIVEYRWDFDGDGQVDRTTSDATVTHAYSSTGEYDASVTVVDDSDQTDSANATVTVEQTDDPPTAELSVSPSTVGNDEEVTLDASNSTDDEGIVEFQWDFDGDGDVDRNTSDATVTHSYSGSGAYDASVTVVDGSEQTDTATATVTVEDTNGSSPTAELDGPDAVTVGEQFTLDASNSTDDGSIVEYRWDFDGDGEVDRTTSDATTTYAFENASEHTITVIVEDDDGNNATATHTMTVEENSGPTAELTATPSQGSGETKFTFDASDSSDDQGIEQYRWDFDGDGEFEATTTDPNTSRTYSEPGRHEVTVQVVDAAGNTDTASTNVTVFEIVNDAPPTAGLTAAERGAMSEEFVLDASNSTDDEGIEWYKWDVDGDGEFDWVGGKMTTFNPWEHFDEPGTYTATVMVGDGEGQTDTDAVTFTIEKRDHTEPKAAIDVRDTVEVGQTVTIRATDFTEGPDTLAHICWELDGEGTVDGKTWTTSFEETGEREITLVLKDRAGNLNEITTTITVIADDGNDGSNDGGSNDDGSNDGETTPGESGVSDGDDTDSKSDGVPAANPGGQNDGNDAQNDGTASAPLTDDDSDGEVVVESMDSKSAPGLEVDETAPASVESPTAAADGFEAVSYLNVTDATRATVTVSKAQLTEFGATADAVTLFRYDDGTWTAVETAQVEETDDAYRFGANVSDGTYAVGIDRPATDVTDVTVSSDRVEPGETVTIVVTVENDGRAEGTREVSLTVGGEVVATKNVSVAAGETTEVIFSHAPETSGVYEVSVGDEATELVVEGIETDTTTTTSEDATGEVETSASTTNDDSAGVPGFGVGVSLVALLAAALLARRRR